MLGIADLAQLAQSIDPFNYDEALALIDKRHAGAGNVTR